MEDRYVHTSDKSVCTLDMSADVVKESILDESEPSTSGSEGLLTSTPPFTMYGLIQFMGSGFMMSVAFLDPGNLEADIQVGVSSQYQLLWWYALCVLCFGYAFQSLSGKIGLVTGKDLAAHIGDRYPKSARYVLWFIMELSLLAADIQETVGCALAVQILSSGTIPLWAGCLIVSVTAFILLQLDRFGFWWIEAVFAILILLEVIALGMGAFSTGAYAPSMQPGA
ncbi:hypothetical protein CEUSTIGMA_g1076.t1 [Chlamydomonas eustigma]|uniref:Natural resistance-associated macrophage protein n=1 Tax=Chlamydomonas eustigma TaxID=1157962 RepID=A0A250WS09_9CHLO|nr:hypothetical protein CEUSTIGMA_g1076.t1 [Chlamydomonas eustigma]|eukprot:GAX73625.1 hypothetical protein CEUSTIGMA_g1076.t1 [Chlamydomonas eustigma]